MTNIRPASIPVCHDGLLTDAKMKWKAFITAMFWGIYITFIMNNVKKEVMRHIFFVLLILSPDTAVFHEL